MPAVSKTQQRLMGQAHGVRKWMDTNGKEGLDPKDIKSAYRETIVDIAKSMKKKSLKDFASTEHKGLPDEIEEGLGEKGNPGKVPTLYPYLNPEANKPKKKTLASKMQKLSDYREFIANKK